MIWSSVQVLMEKLYKRLKQSRLAFWCFPKYIRQDIDILGKDEHTYYAQKLVYVGVFGLFAIVLSVFYLVQAVSSKGAQIDSIIRPEPYEDTMEITLQAGKDGHIYSLEIAPVTLTKEQADALFLEAAGLLETYILENNQSLEMVKENLFLPEEIPQYPFDIYWESDKEHVVDSKGTVNRMELEEDELVVLTAVFQYDEWIWQKQFGILVCKEELTDNEQYERYLGYLLRNSEKDQRNKSTWELPERFEGEALAVSIVEKDYTILFLTGVSLVAAVAVWIGQDYDLHALREKRREVFATEYMSFVESLSLYISAGVTIHTAMQYCARDYMTRKGKNHLLANALSEFQRDLQNGCGFLEAMELFAAKADDSNYKRLAGILSQGVVNGSRGLTEVLEQEVDKVREAKSRQCKVKGEQVSTALIAPMMLQLGIIIALIMIPAFSNMQF